MGGKPTVPAQYACIGEFLWDHFGDARTLGGAPSNVAFHLAQLGAPVALLSRVGTDEAGMRAVSDLRAAGVDTSWVQLDRDRPTGRVEVEIRRGEPRYKLVRGCAWEAIECTTAVSARLARVRAVCFGTLAQRTADGRRGHHDALARLPADAVSLCDVNFRRGFDDWNVVQSSLRAATAAKLNDAEADAIASRFDLDGATAIARHFELDHLALTHGAGGCTLYFRGDSVHQPGVSAPPGGDNVGCGDAFCAVLLLGLVNARDMAAIARAANTYAAFVASHRGATKAPPAAMVAQVRQTLDHN